MLIINNGVPKSGSTWVQKVLSKALNPAFPSDTWRNGWGNPSIDLPRLQGYVESEEWLETTTIVKMHFAYTKQLDFLKRDDVRIIVSHRNLPDSVMSFFYHQVRQGEAERDKLPQWLRTRGRAYAYQSIKQRLSWLHFPNVHFVRYEDLLADFVGESQKLLAFLGRPMSDQVMRDIGQSTRVTLKAGEKPRDGSHIRTAGVSVSKDEMPKPLYDEFALMDKIFES